jgi:hypothetical protein
MPLVKTDLSFAKVGGPPDDWVHVVVLDLETTERIIDAIVVKIWNLADGRGEVTLLGEGGDITSRQGRFAIMREVN